MELSITIVLIIITAITSFIAFNNQTVMDDLIFYPPAITNRNQWYRFITCGFIHADIQHLAFNMLSFYFFGQSINGNVGVEDNFKLIIFGDKGNLLYILLYFSALFVCLLPTYLKNKNNANYRSLGASGAVSAIIFTGIFIFPTMKINLFFLPGIPGFVFGPLYLIITAILDKRGKSNINHSAHFWGAVYGILFFIVACFAFTNFNPFTNFMDGVSAYLHSFQK